MVNIRALLLVGNTIVVIVDVDVVVIVGVVGGSRQVFDRGCRPHFPWFILLQQTRINKKQIIIVISY